MNLVKTKPCCLPSDFTVLSWIKTFLCFYMSLYFLYYRLFPAKLATASAIAIVVDFIIDKGELYFYMLPSRHQPCAAHAGPG